MFFNRKKKKFEATQEEILTRMAVKPAVINAHLLIAEVKQVVKDYLTAVFEARVDLLPMSKMEEQIYNAAANAIVGEQAAGVRRKVSVVDFGSVKTVEYDNRFMYMVHSITYEVEYYITGVQYFPDASCDFTYHRIGQFMFHYDSRLGWVLAQCLDDGEVRSSEYNSVYR